MCIISKIHTTGLDITAHINHKIGTSIFLRCIGQFPIDCQLQQRELAGTDQVVVNEWFDNDDITIGSMMDTMEKQNLSKRLLYTWRECFANKLRDIKPTDLIKYFIDLKPNVQSLYLKIPCYTKKERQFCDCISPEMRKADIIT